MVEPTVVRDYRIQVSSRERDELESLLDKLRGSVVLKQFPGVAGADYKQPVRATGIYQGDDFGLEVTPANGCYLKVLPVEGGVDRVRFQGLEYGRLDLVIEGSRYSIETGVADDLVARLNQEGPASSAYRG